MATWALVSKSRTLRIVLSGVAVVALIIGLHVYKQHSIHTLVSPEAPSQLEVKNYDHPAMRLTKGVVPPTNKWYSSLVFSGLPQPVYAYPLSAKVSESAIELGYPQVKVNDDAVFGAHVSDLKLQLGSTSRQVLSYDDLSVTVGHYSQDNELLARTRLTQGSPYSFTDFPKGGTFYLQHIGDVEQVDDQHAIISDGTKTFGLYIRDGAIHNAPGDTVTITTNADSFLSIYVIGQGSDRQALAEAAEARITATEVSYAVDSHQSKTTYRISTDTNKPTIFVSAPQNSAVAATQIDQSYESILGHQVAYSGTNFTATEQVSEPPLTLNVAALTDVQKTIVMQQLRKDVAATKVGKIDSYFGGKELYRVANLLELSDQLHDVDSKQKLQKLLTNNLDAWLAASRDSGRLSRKFVYDDTIKGVIGVEPSFGSEHFNDHHFHYGYFIYAASVAAQFDSNFTIRNGAAVQNLINDIAAEQSSAAFPKFRSFDAYVGHSWASGYSDFADGNNQESSSEAINAWYGIYRWGKATHNKNLTQRGLWLYTSEVAATKQYWLADRQAEFPGYKRTFSSLIWSGKLSSGTFFSAREQDALGIQLIPFSPGQSYLQSLSKETINKQIASVAPAPEDVNGQFSDYLAMYQSLTDKNAAIKIAQKVPDDNIDDANARSYMMAWIYSQK